MKLRYAISVLVLAARTTVLAPPSQTTGSVFAYFSFPAPPADFSNYTLYYGTTSSNYAIAISTGNQTNATISGLIRGQTYYFNVTQRTTNNIESDYTTEASITIPAKPPKANSLTGQ